jgi:dihydrofolate synthase/folylpolyglutamate synthase
MSYTAAVQHLYGLQQFGIKLGLENMRRLTALLGEPQTRYRSVHIAGTNGKGSTAAMVASMLRQAGYRVGLYTSPHLVEFRERIRVDGRMIPEDAVSELTERIRGLWNEPLAPTFFEFTTAMAFQFFADQQVDVAVLEVGLGGRWDATNVVRPIVTAITTIGYDHEEYLGSTLAAIAGEKAGIIKDGVPVALGPIEGEALAVIQQVAARHGGRIVRPGAHYRLEGSSPQDFSYAGPSWRLGHLRCGLAGSHQVGNAGCALAILEAATEHDLCVPEAAIRSGLAMVAWDGRLEYVGDRPAILLDGAHNPAAAGVLAEFLSHELATGRFERLLLVLGMMKDKRPRAFLEPLLPLLNDLILTRAEISRAAPADMLASAIMPLPIVPHLTDSPAEALALARRLASPEDLVCVAGSLMLVGDVKALLRGACLSPLRG